MKEGVPVQCFFTLSLDGLDYFSFIDLYNLLSWFNFLTYCPYPLQKMVDEEELQFHEEYMNEKDPSILHFLLASGDDVWISYDSCIYLLQKWIFWYSPDAVIF